MHAHLIVISNVSQHSLALAVDAATLLKVLLTCPKQDIALLICPCRLYTCTFKASGPGHKERGRRPLSI